MSPESQVVFRTLKEIRTLLLFHPTIRFWDYSAQGILLTSQKSLHGGLWGPQVMPGIDPE